MTLGWTLVGSADVSNRPVGWKVLQGFGGPFEFPAAEQHRFRQRHDFVRFFRTHLTGARLRLPLVDFTRYEVEVFTVGARSSAGYSLRVQRVYERRGKIVIVVNEHAPRLGSRASAALTFPFVAVRLTQRREPVAIDWPQHP